MIRVVELGYNADRPVLDCGPDMLKRYSFLNLVRASLSGHSAWRDPEPKKNYDVMIVGGGGHGLATAYYLARNHGITDIAVLEKGWLGGGNTGRNTTIIRSNYMMPGNALFYEWSLKLWERLSRELNFNVMFSARGVLNLAHSSAQMDQYACRGNSMRLNGIDAQPHLAELTGRGGHIVFGYVAPIPGAAVATEGTRVHATLLRREGETFDQLLARLDARSVSLCARVHLSTSYPGRSLLWAAINRYEQSRLIERTRAACARDTLSGSNDCLRVVAWVRRFIEAATIAGSSEAWERRIRGATSRQGA